MWKLKLLVGALFLIAIVVVGMVVSADNDQIVQPVFIGFHFPQATLGVWLFVALLVGGILGFIVSIVSAFKNLGQKARLARKLKQCEQELNQLRTSNLRQ